MQQAQVLSDTWAGFNCTHMMQYGALKLHGHVSTWFSRYSLFQNKYPMKHMVSCKTNNDRIEHGYCFYITNLRDAVNHYIYI